MSNKVQIAGSPIQISATAQLLKVPGVLLTVVVGTTTGGTLQFYDSNNAQTTNPITPVLTLTAGASVLLCFEFTQGLYVVVGGTITAAAGVAT
jgi:hypothetical protein